MNPGARVHKAIPGHQRRAQLKQVSERSFGLDELAIPGHQRRAQLKLDTLIEDWERSPSIPGHQRRAQLKQMPAATPVSLPGPFPAISAGPN